jgi:hypothetical protein
MLILFLVVFCFVRQENLKNLDLYKEYYWRSSRLGKAVRLSFFTKNEVVTSDNSEYKGKAAEER